MGAVLKMTEKREKRKCHKEMQKWNLMILRCNRLFCFHFIVDFIYNDVTYHEEIIEEMPKTIFGEGF